MAKHQDLGAEKAHVPGFFQETDPGAVGAGKLWIDTSGGTGNWVIKLRNEADDDWEAVSGNSGYTDHGALLGLGDDDHPQYLTEAEADARIPHFNPGTGDLNVIGESPTCGVSGTGADTAIVSAFDLIKSLHGGVVSPAYAFTLTSGLAATITGNGGSDPTAVYISYTQVEVGQLDLVTLQVSDGTNTNKTLVTVNVVDTDSI